MPLPTPRKGEIEKKFISRCMGDPAVNAEFPENKQRAGVCYSQWRAKRESITFDGLLGQGYGIDVAGGILAHLDERKSDFQILKDNQVKLEPDERKEVMDKKATWHFSPKFTAVPAVWKSRKADGSFVYITNTHRAYQVRPTLKGAISIYHSFIKGTA